MNFLALARQRYSCRDFLPKPIEDDKIASVLEAGRIAPSAVNFQPRFFIVIRDPDNLQWVKSCYAKTWMASAPVVIVACGDHQKSWKRDDGKDHSDIDVAIAVDHMTLEATSLGLGTCWVCKFDAKRCAEILHLPSHIEPVVLLPIGYPAATGDPDRHTRLRKPLTDIVKWEAFND